MDEIVQKHDAILEEMNHGDAAALGKELSSLAPIARLHVRLVSVNEEETSLKELMEDAVQAGDDEMAQDCREELDGLETSREKLEQRLLKAVLPKDEDDFGMDAVLEIRAGTGGDEAALFAAELLNAYMSTAKSKGWKAELLSQSKTDLGGIKDSAISISGNSYSGFGMDDDDDEEESDPMAALGPYGFFKYESGVHRVQRVPVNDVRIHTSACSVAVLPSPKDDSSDSGELLPMSELKIETMRASGAGGQHVNTTDSAVRVTHIPTGVTAAIQDERSQHKNKAKALKLVTARVRDRKLEEEARERGDTRNSLMGGGDRSERIRTYNYPQDRVTDHRCKQSEHGISRMLQGGDVDGLVATFASPMRTMTTDELIRQLEES